MDVKKVKVKAKLVSSKTSLRSRLLSPPRHHCLLCVSVLISSLKDPIQIGLGSALKPPDNLITALKGPASHYSHSVRDCGSGLQHVNLGDNSAAHSRKVSRGSWQRPEQALSQPASGSPSTREAGALERGQDPAPCVTWVWWRGSGHDARNLVFVGEKLVGPRNCLLKRRNVGWRMGEAQVLGHSVCPAPALPLPLPWGCPDPGWLCV